MQRKHVKPLTPETQVKVAQVQARVATLRDLANAKGVAAARTEMGIMVAAAAEWCVDELGPQTAYAFFQKVADAVARPIVHEASVVRG